MQAAKDGPEPPAASSSKDSAEPGRSQPSGSPPPPQGSTTPTSETSSLPPEQGPSTRKTLFKDNGMVPTLDLFFEMLAEKFNEGNKMVASKEQERRADGTFGKKGFLDCSWRTWIKRMFDEYPGVQCTCTCNNKPISSGQGLIKHIERKHYVNYVVSFDEYDLTVTPPPE